MTPTRRMVGAGLAAWALALQRCPASAGHEISVMIAIDGTRVITKDLKWIQLAEPAAVHFVLKTNYIEMLFKDDLKVPLNWLRSEVLSSARRALGNLAAKEALSAGGMRALIEELNRNVAYLGVEVRNSTLRYVLSPTL